MKAIVISLILLVVTEIAVADDADIGLLSQAEEYESPVFKKLVTHCTSHVAEACKSEEALDQKGTNGLAHWLFDSMEKCLVDHGAEAHYSMELPYSMKHLPVQIDPPTAQHPLLSQFPSPPISMYHPLFIQTIKFRTVLRTCTHVSAQTCLTAPNHVASPLLAACLIPSIKQCVYPGDSPVKA